MANTEETTRTVIFLDIDGVLQPGECQDRFKHDPDQLRRNLATRFEDPAYLYLDKYDLGAVHYDWHRKAVERLRRLCVDFGAEIVVISDWRRRKSLSILKAYFRIHDLHHYVTDKTDESGEAPLYRAGEVQEYLDTHPEIGRFVIIDDGYRHEFDQLFPDQFVNTGSHIKEDDARRAHQILSGGPVTVENPVLQPLFGGRTDATDW